MKQQSFFKSARKDHGGALSIKKRRSRRPLATKLPLHVTLRSDFAKGPRSLLKHRALIDRILHKAATRFAVKIYQQAICGNHLHLVIKGQNRQGIQNFFRVVAGHIAQQILWQFPLPPVPGGAPKLTMNDAEKPGCLKNQRRFWALLIYSRILSWGREYKIVIQYLVKNTLEALNILAYEPRRHRKRASNNNSG